MITPHCVRVSVKATWIVVISALRSSTAAGCALLLNTILGCGSTGAITFDSDTGYTNGALLETTPTSGTKWTRGANSNDTEGALQVESAPGVDRQQAVITCKSNDATIMEANYYFAPTATDLGGTFNASSSIVNYSISMAIRANPGTYTGNVAQVVPGIPEAAFFWLTGDGRVTASLGDDNQGILRPGIRAMPLPNYSSQRKARCRERDSIVHQR